MTAPSWPETGVLYTPERHRQLARIWLKHAGEPGYPTVTRAKQMAINHEQAAKLITIRLAKAGTTTPLLLAAPSITLNYPDSSRPGTGASRCSCDFRGSDLVRRAGIQNLR